jgi:hypothetical protein
MGSWVSLASRLLVARRNNDAPHAVSEVLSMAGAAAAWLTRNVLESSSCPRVFPL